MLQRSCRCCLATLRWARIASLTAGTSHAVLLRQRLSTEPGSFSDLNASNCDCLMSGMQLAETIMILSPEDVIKACTCWCFHGGPNRA